MKVIEICTYAAPAIYILLTITAIISLYSPLLSQLASHGKTRIVISNDPKENEKETPRAAKSTSHVTTAIMIRLRLLDHDRFQIRKHHFVHFYTVGITWAAFILWNHHQRHQSRRNNVTTCTLLLYLHLARRCYECRYVHIWNGSMHIAGFALGLLHYILLPFIFLGNGIEIQHHHGHGHDHGHGHLYLIMGVVINLFSQYEQHLHHCILANYRKNGVKEINGGKRYSIPHGRWFAYVSCPHYLAEIMIYASFAILLHHQYDFGIANGAGTDSFLVQSAISLCSSVQPFKHVILVAWVAINLAISARSSHAWYQKQFPGYPKHRTALIPFLW